GVGEPGSQWRLAAEVAIQASLLSKAMAALGMSAAIGLRTAVAGMRCQRGVGPTRASRPSVLAPRATAPTPQTELVPGTVDSWKSVRWELPKDGLDGPVQAPLVRCQILTLVVASPPAAAQMPPWPSGAMLVSA